MNNEFFHNIDVTPHKYTYVRHYDRDGILPILQMDRVTDDLALLLAIYFISAIPWNELSHAAVSCAASFEYYIYYYT